jgi:hypothetical protein
MKSMIDADWSARGPMDRATSKIEAAMHFKLTSWTGVVRYTPGDLAPYRTVAMFMPIKENSS